MSNIYNSLIDTNNNVVAAQKLSDKKTGSRKNLGLINLPATTYTYSSDEYLREMDDIRKLASRDRIKREVREKKAQAFKSLLKSIVYCSFVYIFIKNVKLNKLFI